jgi:Uma2 family endonuclease
MDDVLATVDVRRRRFTVEEYYRMAEVGILTERDRVELIEGEIIEMSPIGFRHAFCASTLITRLTRAIGDRAHIWPSNPVRLFPDTEPQPDVTFIHGPLSRYSEHPGPADVVLLIEVSDTSYRFDRYVKLPLYACAGVPEVWIVDLTPRSEVSAAATWRRSRFPTWSSQLRTSFRLPDPRERRVRYSRASWRKRRRPPGNLRSVST